MSPSRDKITTARKWFIRLVPAVLLIASIVVYITPNKADDAALAIIKEAWDATELKVENDSQKDMDNP